MREVFYLKGTQLYSKVASSYWDNWGEKLVGHIIIPQAFLARGGKLANCCSMLMLCSQYLHLLCVSGSSNNRTEIIIGLPHGIWPCLFLHCRHWIPFHLSAIDLPSMTYWKADSYQYSRTHPLPPQCQVLQAPLWCLTKPELPYTVSLLDANVRLLDRIGSAPELIDRSLASSKVIPTENIWGSR